jgi:hypothetical protein
MEAAVAVLVPSPTIIPATEASENSVILILCSPPFTWEHLAQRSVELALNVWFICASSWQRRPKISPSFNDGNRWLAQPASIRRLTEGMRIIRLVKRIPQAR